MSLPHEHEGRETEGWNKQDEPSEDLVPGPAGPVITQYKHVSHFYGEF
jgi:hypothetical protein